LSNEDLLRPTLSDYRKPPALYGSTGFFVAAFFGGPVGAGIYAAANSWRLGRLWRDLPVIVALAAGAFLLLIVFNRIGFLDQLDVYLENSKGDSMPMLVRAMGIACFGAIYLMHRGYFRAARVSGANSLQGWVPGIVALVAGYASSIAFDKWIQHH
jgi:hypothetical protein